jgi:transcriptional regulator with XRE-family HTH domain
LKFTEKLDILMKEHGLNKHSLAKATGVGYTTIDAFYKKGYENMKLSNFRAICDYFKVTMDSMARDDVEFPEAYNPNAKNIHISKEEEILVTRYREADNFDKELVLRALRVDAKGDAQKMA